MDTQNYNREGLSHIYLDEKKENQSNVALGILCRAIGHELKIIYINSKKNAFEIIHSFSSYLLKKVSFYDYDSFSLDFMKNSDLIIFDNFLLKKFSYERVNNLLENRNKKTEIIFVAKNKDDFKKIKDKFDLISVYKYVKNNKGKENITNIYGIGKGKSTYAFGSSIKQLINKNKVKIIYFDKGGDFYGEKYFFEKLKKSNKNFDYKSFGLSRMENDKFRQENLSQDLKEAKKGLVEIKNYLKEDLVIADELNTTINSNLLEENAIIETLNEVNHNLLITGREPTYNLLNIAKYHIEVVSQKHYFTKGYGCRKGIDL